MKIRVLGCMGGRIPTQELSGFLVDGELALDAGSISASLDLLGQCQVKNLILTHLHLDHLYGLGFLLENRLLSNVSEPLNVFASKEGAEILRTDFLREEIVGVAVSRNLDKLMRLSEVEAGKEYRIGKYLVEPAPVNHYAGGMGFFVSDGQSEFLYSSDTGPTDRIWERFKQKTNCGLLITEVSFPNKLEEVARLSRHFTPALLKIDLEKTGGQDRIIYLYHFKPGYLDLLFQELTEITNFDLHLLRTGMELEVERFVPKDQTPVRVRSEPPSGKVPSFDFSKDLYEQRQAMDREFGISFEPSAIIFEEGDPGNHMFIIQEGSVEVFRMLLGKKKSLSVLGPGDVFGEMSLICNHPRTATVRAVTRVRAYTFDRAAFEQLVRKNYGIALKIIRMLAQRLQEADVHIENLLYPDNESKLLNTIIRAIADEGIKTKDAVLLRLTPEQLAIRTDLAMDELKRLLAKIMRAGNITFKDGLFRIPDPELLKKFLDYLETKQKYESADPGKVIC